MIKYTSNIAYKERVEIRKKKNITSCIMCWRTSSQLSEKSNPTFEWPLLTSLEGPHKASKHLKANISLMFFPKSSSKSGANSIKSETKKPRLIKKIIKHIY